MWKIVAAVGGVVSVGVVIALWCCLKTGSDEDDFWGIGDERTEEIDV
ncbi:MAG: hypothetical protein MJ097_00850 [Dorea sp.]|nr:hypothetical protein [Dorea sp.]